jgi:aminoglycoside phosphotransferase (APT) family kinase protein
MKRSSRDPEELRASLERWLANQLPPGSNPQIPKLWSPSASGMSSETLLFDASWTEDGNTRTEPFVARVEPDPEDVPVFPVYDLESQFRLLRLVGENSKVPVPSTPWIETDPGPLGAPFFVMGRVEGRVPPDVMPYNMDSWLLEASPAEQRLLQDSTVNAIADLHSIDISNIDTSFLEFDVPGETPMRRHFENQRRLYDWMRRDRHHPILEEAIAWLESHWPDDEGESVISWGDSRIGNVLYDGFEPAALLDWEMAAIGPRELDISWCSFLHFFFEDIAQGAGLPGMPNFLRLEDVAATYTARCGYEPKNLPFYEVYAALRHGVVMARVHERRVHFGEAEWPEDVDSVIMHRAGLQRMLDGSYW